MDIVQPAIFFACIWNWMEMGGNGVYPPSVLKKNGIMISD